MALDTKELGDLLEGLADPVRAAGRAAVAIRQAGLTTRIKADGSPVSDADEAAEAIVLGALEDVAPDIAVISEENPESHGFAPPDRFFLVDPIDGTKEFMKKNGSGDFTVNVGLIENGMPVMGLVFAPAHGTLFAGVVGTGAFRLADGERRAISVRDVPEAGALAIISNARLGEETTKWLESRGVSRTVPRASSLKIALIASGEADLYPRFGPNMEWDTAAAHAVLCAAGGRIDLIEGGALTYGKPDYRNRPFVARGRFEA